MDQGETVENWLQDDQLRVCNEELPGQVEDAMGSLGVEDRGSPTADQPPSYGACVGQGTGGLGAQSSMSSRGSDSGHGTGSQRRPGLLRRGQGWHSGRRSGAYVSQGPSNSCRGCAGKAVVQEHLRQEVAAHRRTLEMYWDTVRQLRQSLMAIRALATPDEHPMAREHGCLYCARTTVVGRGHGRTRPGRPGTGRWPMGE
jgi:hypothetical protein